MADQAANAVPEPRDDDDEDLAFALTTASTMWKRGDRDEAIKWVKRAVEHAADADLDDRALELGKLVADLASRPLPSATTTPKPSAAPPPPPPAASRPEAPRKKTGMTGKHAAIRDGAPAAKTGRTGKHKAISMTSASDALTASPATPVRPSAPSSPATPSTPPRPAMPGVPRPLSGSSFPARPSTPPAARLSQAPPPVARPSALPVNPATQRAPLPARPSSAPTAPTNAPRSVSAPALTASPSRTSNTSLPSLKAAPVPVIERIDEVIHEQTMLQTIPEIAGDTEEKTAAIMAPPAEPIDAPARIALLQTVRVYVTAGVEGARISVAHPGSKPPHGAIEALLTATHAESDLAALLRG